jgi:hypothetical protein
VADVVLQALAKSPDERPTAREFGNRLAAAAGLHAYRSTTATTGRLAGRVSSTPEEDDGVTVLPESQDTLLLERSQTDASHAPDTQPTQANLAGANRTDEQNR